MVEMENGGWVWWYTSLFSQYEEVEAGESLSLRSDESTSSRTARST